MEIGEIIALNLKRLREERNLSLRQLAEMAGVSKVMLSQLEKGTSNPTINTVWKITGALQLPYTSLLEFADSKAVHIKKQDIRELKEGKYHIFSYYGKGENRPFDLYEIEMDAGSVHESIGHSSNSTEYIIITEGRMILEVGEEIFQLEKEDGFCFEAAVPHTYKNPSEEKTKAILMIHYR